MKRKKKADLACRAVVRRGLDREEEEEGRSGGGGGEQRWIPILG